MTALAEFFHALGALLAEQDRSDAGQEQSIAAPELPLAEPVGDPEQLPAAEEAVAEPAPAPEAEQPKRKKNKAHYTLTCQVCGTVFKATTRNGKYCPACRNREKAKNIAAAHARYREKQHAASARADSYVPSPRREEADMIYGNSIDL